MGFGGFGGVGKLFGKGKSLIGGLDAKAGKWMDEKLGLGWLDISKQGEGGLGDIATFGMGAQAEATREAKRARDAAAKQYQAEIAAAEATANKIAESEEERKRRLALAGSQTPSTLLNTYLGLSGPANVRRAYLG